MTIKKITLKEFHNRIDQEVTESYVSNPPKKNLKSMGQSQGVRWGQKTEPVLVEFLKQHPNYASHKTQVRFRPVGGTSCIDVVMQTKKGNTVYIPVVKDSWSGTAQIDRLEMTYYKWKGGFLKNYNFCFLAALDYKDRLSRKFTKKAIKERIVNELITEMADNKIFFNVETLWEHLKTL